MKKTDYKKPLIVGVFLFTGILILIAGTFMIGSQEGFFEKEFTVKAVFDDVGGLQKGNKVWLSGVKVGIVKKVSFSEKAQVEVTLSIEKKARPLIWKNSKAKVSADGFIGNKIVVIYGGTAEAGTAANGDFLTSEKGISTEEMMVTLQANNKNLLQITDDFKRISKKIADGEGTIGGLVNDNTIIKDIQSTMKNLRAASVKTEAALNDVQQFTSQLNNKDGLLNELITDTIVFKNLENIVTQLKQTTSAAAVFVENIQTASSKLNEKNNPAGMLLHDEETTKNLKEIINNLKTSSQKLDEDLEAIQHNFLFRGYFRKKAKNKGN